MLQMVYGVQNCIEKANANPLILCRDGEENQGAYEAWLTRLFCVFLPLFVQNRQNNHDYSFVVLTLSSF